MSRGVPTDRALVIVPTYNERATIGSVVEKLFDAVGEGVDLLVVDDSSPDGTAMVVTELGAIQPDRIHLLSRPDKQGLGSAYVEGFRWAATRGYEVVVEMDADLSHDPADVPRLLSELERERADLVIGSRYVAEGRIPRWGPLRRALSFGGNLYARRWLRLPVRDSTSGFRAFRLDPLGPDRLHEISSDGYAFQIEIVHRMHRRGAKIAEIPITFVDRSVGHSKMSRAIIVEALLRVTLWGLRNRFRRRR